jgi:hypothetical protein
VCGTLAISRAWSVGPIIKCLSRGYYPHRLRLFLPQLRPQVSLQIVSMDNTWLQGDERMVVRSHVSSKYWIVRETLFLDPSSHSKSIHVVKQMHTLTNSLNTHMLIDAGYFNLQISNVSIIFRHLVWPGC